MSRIFNGHISIGRFTSTEEPYRGVSITIEDDRYHRIAVISMTIPQWGDVISGLGSVKCSIELYIPIEDDTNE